MPPADPNPITILIDAAGGDRQAAENLLPLLYTELRRLANAKLAHEHPGQTLQATARVHEAYLRLLGPGQTASEAWQGRGHFFAAAAEAMRRILIERARAKGAVKHGGSALHLTLDPDLVRLDEPPEGLIELHEALARFEVEEPDKAMLVKLRFFGGLTQKQASAVLGLPPTTADLAGIVLVRDRPDPRERIVTSQRLAQQQRDQERSSTKPANGQRRT